MKTYFVRSLVVSLLVAGAAPMSTPTWANENAAVPLENSEVWPAIKKNVFGDRDVIVDSKAEVLEMYLAPRADDASSVPVIVRAKNPQRDDDYIKQIWLIVDKNPSPMAGVFRYTRDSGLANLETRIRVEDFTHVRAVAERSDGKLYMAGKWIKASGGCSAPAGGDSLAAAGLGRIKFKIDDAVSFNEPNKVQLMISHPNISGLAMDQLSRLYPNPHYVSRIDVSYEGVAVMSADVDFSISMNPVFRFYFQPKGAGKLRALITDSKDLKFEQTIAIEPGKVAGESIPANN
jgi:sulfur-oxidizing protein SoxY